MSRRTTGTTTRPRKGAPAFPKELDARAAGEVCDEGAWQRWLESHDGGDRQAELDADLERPLDAATRLEERLTTVAARARAGSRRLFGVISLSSLRTS